MTAEPRVAADPPALFSMFKDGDSARTRFSDPITSHEAADSNNVHDSHTVVFGVLAEHGPLADHELVTWDDTFTPQRMRSARSELVELGKVEDTGIYRLTPAGRRAKVWQVIA